MIPWFDQWGFSDYVDLAFVVLNMSMWVYGAHYWYVTVTFWANEAAKSEKMEGGNKAIGTGSSMKAWPMVTIQLPIFNEGAVAARLIESCLGIDYPADRCEIQVLDDSIDSTPQVVANAIARLSPTKFPVRHCRRTDRTGYKAGALEEGLRTAKGEFIAIFDADFVPGADYLKNLIPEFYTTRPVTCPVNVPYKGIACVQCAWGFLNRDYSILTRLQALAIDGHFQVEQPARCDGGFLLNFNGTGGIWRKEAIEDAGGWSWDTLAEDLDLSYRAQFKGWKIVYTREFSCPSELPPSIDAFKKQQHRWAKGTMQCLRKHLLPIWLNSTISLKLKIEATFQMAGYLVNTIMFISMFLAFPAQIWREGGFVIDAWRTILPLIMIGALGPSSLYVTAQISKARDRLSYKQIAGYILPLVLLGYGLCSTVGMAAVEGFFVKGGAFVRTEKFGITDATASQASYYAESNKIQEAAIATPAAAPVEEAPKKKGASKAWKLFPRTELIVAVTLMALWSIKLLMPGVDVFSSSDIFVFLYLISNGFMVYLGLEDIRAMHAAEAAAATPLKARLATVV